MRKNPGRHNIRGLTRSVLQFPIPDTIRLGVLTIEVPLPSMVQWPWSDSCIAGSAGIRWTGLHVVRRDDEGGDDL